MFAGMSEVERSRINYEEVVPRVLKLIILQLLISCLLLVHYIVVVEVHLYKQLLISCLLLVQYIVVVEVHLYKQLLFSSAVHSRF